MKLPGGARADPRAGERGAGRKPEQPSWMPKEDPQPVVWALLGRRRASRGGCVPVLRVGSCGEEPGATSVVSGSGAGLVRGLRSWAGPGLRAPGPGPWVDSSGAD